MSDHDEKPAGKKKPLLSLPHSHVPQHEEGEGNWLVSYADMMTLLVGFFVILISFSTIDQDKLEGMRKELTVQFGGSYQAPYSDMSDRIRTELTKLGLGDQFMVKQNNQGLDISFMGTVFFDTGKADLKPEASEMLKKLIPVVQNEAKSDFNIVVEGHTDDVPIGTGLVFKNNWELSSIRACRVLSAFYEEGFSKLRLTALGFGESRPIAPNRDPAGNAIISNQSQNRRVVIRIIKRLTPALGTDSLPPVELEN